MLEGAYNFCYRSGVNYLSPEIALAYIMENASNGQAAMDMRPSYYCNQRRLFSAGFKRWTKEREKDVDYGVIWAIHEGLQRTNGDEELSLENFIFGLCFVTNTRLLRIKEKIVVL